MMESTAIPADETSSTPDHSPFGFDRSRLIEAQQRQIDAFGRATAIISSTVSAVISKQLDLLQKEAAQIATEMTLLFDVRNPADVVPKQVATVRSAFDETLADLREINDITRKGTLELFDVLRSGVPREIGLSSVSPVEMRKSQARSSRAA